jgi:hypothetical protein
VPRAHRAESPDELLLGRLREDLRQAHDLEADEEAETTHHETQAMTMTKKLPHHLHVRKHGIEAGLHIVLQSDSMKVPTKDWDVVSYKANGKEHFVGTKSFGGLTYDVFLTSKKNFIATGGRRPRR